MNRHLMTLRVVGICYACLVVAPAFIVECLVGRLMKKSADQVNDWPVNRLMVYFGTLMD